MDKKYSVKYDVNNRPYVVINQNILEGIAKKDLRKTVSNFIRDKFSPGIHVGNNFIKINAKSRSEFVNSKTTQAYFERNKRIFSDKMQSSNNLDEIIWASRDYIEEAPAHERKDSFDSFGRGKVQISINGREYIADIIVGHTHGNEMVFYDIINIKPIEIKKRRASYRVESNRPTLASGHSVSFNNSIPQKDTSVNISVSQNGKNNAWFLPEKERKSKMRVFFDMDGTLNKITNSLMDENGSVQLEKMYKTENFFEHVEPEKKMIELVNKLREQGIEVFSLSSCELGDPPGFEKQKDRWLDKHNVNIGQENRIYVPYGKDKTDYIPGGLQDGDVLIDDYNVNLKEWQNKAADNEVNAKAVKAVNSLNDKGLGALGGDKGNIWDGDRVYTSFSAEFNANTILNIFSESKPEEISLEVNANHKKIMYDAYYYLDMIGSDGLANIEVQSGSRALFSVLQPPNSEQAYLLCDNFDTDGYTLSNLETPSYFKDKQSAVNEFVYRQAVAPKGSDDCLLLFKEDELNKAVHYIKDKMPELNDRLSKMVGTIETAGEAVKPEYKYGLETLSVRKVSGTKTYEVYGTRDGNEKFLFSSDAPTLPFFVDQINSTISANRYRTERMDKQSEVDETQDNEAVVLGNKKFHR